MEEQKYRARNNQNRLMNKLKLPSDSEQITSENLHMQLTESETFQKEPVASSNTPNSKYAAAESNPYQSTEDSPSDDNYLSQPSILRPNIKNKNKKPASNITKKATPVTTNKVIGSTDINDLGEAAEWAEKGTKNDEQQQFDGGDDYQPVSESSNRQSVSQRLEEKANKIMNGTYRAPKASTVNSLKGMAQRIKQENMQKQRAPASESINLPAHHEEQAVINNTSTQNLISKNNITTKIQAAPKPAPARYFSGQDQDEDDKWERINKQTLNKKQTIQNAPTKAKQYSYEELVNHYTKQLDITDHKYAVELQIEQSASTISCWDSFLAVLSPTSQNEALRLQLLCLSKIQMDSQQDYYVLEVLWNHLVSSSPYRRYGDHWQQVGFQGRDPATDLRGSGVLSLFHLYYFLRKHPESFRAYHKLSTSAATQFPYAITYVKITGEYARLLKTGKIGGTTVEEYTDSYCAMAHHIFQILKKRKIDITQFGTVVTEELKSVGANLSGIISAYKRADLK